MTMAESGTGEANGLFWHNAQLLHPALRERLRTVSAEEVRRFVDIVRGPSGDAVCRYGEGEDKSYVTSVEPRKQAEAWCGQLPLERMSALFVFGSGFGYPLLEIARRKRESTFVIVFEQSIHLFAAMLHTMDLRPVLNSGKFAFLVGDFESFAPEFQVLTGGIFIGLTAPSVAFTPEARLFKAQYGRSLHLTLEQFQLQVSKYGNDHEDSLIGFRHLADNADSVLDNPYLSCLKDAFAGIPAFIIANGPSLDEQLAALRKVDGKALVLCSESAIAPLMKQGVRPDAICVLERTARSYHRHFEATVYPDDVCLLALGVVDPRICRSFAGPQIPIFRSSESNSAFFNRIVGDGSALFGGKSSAHLAFEAAAYMGANPIVLVGQDLAYGPDGGTHSKLSVYSEAPQKGMVDFIKSLPVVYVESNAGTQIPSNRIWHQFKLIYEEMIAERPHLTVVNTTVGGARIKGTSVMRLDDAIDRYCRSPLERRLHRVIGDSKLAIDRRERSRKRQALLDELAKYASLYLAFQCAAVGRKDVCEHMLANKTAPETGDIGVWRRTHIDNMEHLFRFLVPPVHTMYFQQIVMVAYHRMNEVGPPGTMEDYRKLLRIQFEWFDRVAFVCGSLAQNFRTAFEQLRSAPDAESGK